MIGMIRAACGAGTIPLCLIRPALVWRGSAGVLRKHIRHDALKTYQSRGCAENLPGRNTAKNCNRFPKPAYVPRKSGYLLHSASKNKPCISAPEHTQFVPPQTSAFENREHYSSLCSLSNADVKCVTPVLLLPVLRLRRRGFRSSFPSLRPFRNGRICGRKSFRRSARSLRR